MENVVVDTNVVLSYALKPNGEAGKAFLNAMENFNILQSNETFEEFVEVINREKFSKYIPDEFREELIDRLAARSELVEINHTVERDLCRDPKDNKFLELAVSGNAKYIISGDKDLLDIKQYKGIEILSPSQFLEKTQKIEQPHTATLSGSATASAQQGHQKSSAPQETPEWKKKMMEDIVQNSPPDPPPRPLEEEQKTKGHSK